MREQYRADNPGCEFWKWIPELRSLSRDGQEINHIFSVGRRPDLVSNLIHLSTAAHHEFFHAHLVDGRILSLWVKHHKGELDEAEIKQASGMFIAGILMKPPTIDWVRPYLDQLREIYP